MTGRGVDYYRILGVSRNATNTEIRQRYLILAKKLHPDHDGDNHLMLLINQAYKVLSEPRLRFKYNQWLDKRESGVITQTSNQPQTTARQEYVQSTKKSRGYGFLKFAVILILLVGALAWYSNSKTQSISTMNSSNHTESEVTPLSSSPAASSSVSDFNKLPDVNSSLNSIPASNYVPPDPTPLPSVTPSYSPSPSTSTSCSSNSIGSYEYTNCYGGGGHISCSTSNIGSYDYTNCYGSGGSTSCSSNNIGSYRYTNCY